MVLLRSYAGRQRAVCLEQVAVVCGVDAGEMRDGSSERGVRVNESSCLLVMYRW